MSAGYVAIDRDSTGYPAGLGLEGEFARLYALGNTELLRSACVGICGSRHATDSALGYAYEFGFVAAQRGFVVVSGHARGVDREAHRGALEGGGATIAVLAEGIDQFSLAADLQGRADFEGNFLALSPFEPGAVWKPWRAMERNKLIVGLSCGLFVIEARARGGTLHAARECIRQGKRLWVIEYQHVGRLREGNRRLLETSAVAVRTKQDLHRILDEAWRQCPRERGRQLSLPVGERELDHHAPER